MTVRLGPLQYEERTAASSLPREVTPVHVSSSCPVPSRLYARMPCHVDAHACHVAAQADGRMYVATGYSDATLMKDVRFKLGLALREARAMPSGLHFPVVLRRPRGPSESLRRCTRRLRAWHRRGSTRRATRARYSRRARSTSRAGLSSSPRRSTSMRRSEQRSRTVRISNRSRISFMDSAESCIIHSTFIHEDPSPRTMTTSHAHLVICVNMRVYRSQLAPPPAHHTYAAAQNPHVMSVRGLLYTVNGICARYRAVEARAGSYDR